MLIQALKHMKYLNHWPNPYIRTDCPIFTLASLFTAPNPEVIAHPNKAAVLRSKFFGITVNLF